MESKKYEEAIDQLSPYLISNYFNDNEVAFYKAKSKLLNLIKDKTKTKHINNLPFLLTFLKNNFVNLCKSYPDFIGFIMVQYKKTNFLKSFIYWFWLYYKFLSVVRLRWNKNKFVEKYQNIHTKILSLIKNKERTRKEIDEIIILIEPISKYSLPRTVQTSFSHIYNELRFSLELLHSTDNLNRMNYFDCHIFDGYYLIKFDIEFATTAKYSNYPLIESMINDLKSIYTQIECEFQNVMSDKTYQPVRSPDGHKFVPNEEQLKIFKEFEKQHGFIARSESMLEIFDLVKRYNNKITILITGETGVGKELIVKAIHKESNQKNKSLISENCAGKDSGILDSTLFGHEKGAFTSADRQHKGIFERADKGTVFLDEIGDMSLNMQNKLLRVIQEKTITRLGGEKEIPVDFRLICATNKNLNKLVQQGKFKEDLLNRIDVASIAIPSLNERPDDIPYLAEYLFNKFQKEYVTNQYNRAPDWISSNNFTPLKQHYWKGNVRGLEHYMERFVIYNKEVLSKLKPEILRKLFKNKKLSIQDLVKNPTSNDKIFHDNKYFEILMLYIENHYDRPKTTEVSGYHIDTVRSRLSSSMLQLGKKFEFQEESMVNYLVEQNILTEKDRDIFTKKIIEVFNYIITASIRKTKRNFYDPADKQLLDALFKSRIDLVDLIKNTLSNLE